MRKLLLLVAFLFSTQIAEASHLYRLMMVRAAPGKLPDLIELYEKRMPVYDTSGDKRPMWMRHTQGDQWDLLFIYPMGSFGEYYAADRISRREKAAADSDISQEEFTRLFYEATAWHEDIYMDGPPLDELKKAYDAGGYFHAEIFVALAGKQDELRKERDMENAFRRAVGRVENFTFTHVQGAAWSLVSLAFYRDLAHFAEPSGASPEQTDAAAKAAGFESARSIGTYMRSLIDYHHDTLGVTLK